jgi:protein kinase-like protein
VIIAGKVQRVTRPLAPNDPRRLGDYELVGRLGEGGMGTVFLGRAPDGQLVAVKVIRPEFAWDTEFRGRFRSEVNRAREVPGFCTAAVLDADPDHATPYLVVEYVDGPSLAEVIDEHGPLTGGTLHSVAVGVATALAAIHGAGVIHRDLKPQNVLFSLGTPKVIDFGIARALEATSRHTRTDQMMGTVAYMAPERFDTESDRAAGPPADVFAWGAVVAYAGTGHTPFRADSAAATAARILTQPPEISRLPSPLRELVQLTLAKNPADRPSAHELLRLLLSAESPGSLEQRPELRRAAEAVAHSAQLKPFAVRTDADPRRRRLGGRGRAVVAAVTTVLAVGGAFVGHVMAPSSATRNVSVRSSVPVSSAEVTVRASASAGPVAAAGTPRVQGLSVIDSLDRPGQWRSTPRAGNAGGWCGFDGRRMMVATHQSRVYNCPGPANIFGGDQTIAVDATVVSPNACAVIWLRMVENNGYRVSFCPKDIRIGLDEEGDLSRQKKAPSTAFQPGQTHRAGVSIRADMATVTVDGAAMVSLPLTDPELAAGQVELGVVNDSGEGDAKAAFAGFELKSPVVGTAPRFTDLIGAAKATSAVKLYSYDQAAHAVVAEPILFLSGPGYCTMLHIKPSDQRCNIEWTTIDSHLRITLPVDDRPRLLTFDDGQGNSNCIGGFGTGGRCPLDPPAFAAWIKESKGALAAISVTAGHISKMAEIYTP